MTVSNTSGSHHADARSSREQISRSLCLRVRCPACRAPSNHAVDIEVLRHGASCAAPAPETCSCIGCLPSFAILLPDQLHPPWTSLYHSHLNLLFSTIYTTGTESARFLPTYSVVDIFAGPGGLAEGFSSVQAGDGKRAFHISLSIEKEPSAHSTLRLRSFLRQFPDALPDAYYTFINDGGDEPDWSETHPVQWLRRSTRHG